MMQLLLPVEAEEMGQTAPGSFLATGPHHQPHQADFSLPVHNRLQAEMVLEAVVVAEAVARAEEPVFVLIVPETMEAEEETGAMAA